MARPKLYRNPARLTLNVERATLAKLSRIAFRNNLSRSQLIARWIERENTVQPEPAAATLATK